jgi:hypothetical protein
LGNYARLNVKRISRETSLHRSHQARRSRERDLRRRGVLSKRTEGSSWNGPRLTNYIEAPSVFCLTENYNETVLCLQKLKESVVEAKRLGHKRPNTYIDLAKIKELEPAAAIVLAAELDRWRRVLGVTLRPRNIREWSKSVLTFLYDLGLFELLEVDRRYLARILRTHPNGVTSSVALKFVSGCRNDKEQTDKLADHLAAKVPEFRERLEEEGDMALSTALAEASLNCVQHAYAHGSTRYPVVDHRWWAAASFQDDRKTVKFFVYDQGVGIADTLPRTDFGKEILNTLGVEVEGVSRLASQSDKIRKVLETPMSTTGETNRGKGFPQIVAAVSQKKGSLRVISGTGSAMYVDEGAKVLRENKLHLGGTLLEWTFRLDRM